MTTFFKQPRNRAVEKREQVKHWKASLRARHLKGLPRRRYPKSTRKQVVKELDDVFSLFIRYRDGFICFTCGSQSRATMQCGHLITRAKFIVRWDELNAHAQCSGCNLSHEYHPEIFTQKYIAKHGMETYNRLVQSSQQIAKFSDRQLTGMILYYKQELRKRFGVEILTRR